jgi:hypothetical protein
MLIFFAATLLLILSWVFLWLNRLRCSQILQIGWVSLLIIWLNQEANFFNLGRDEEGLLKWIGLGLLFILFAILSQILNKSTKFSRIFYALSALSYALALDVFRPDEYGYFPAAIIGAMVLLVALRIIQRLHKATGFYLTKISPLVLLPSLMLYASFYKLFDRNWVLPWSYLMAAGISLFALSQLWQAWSDFELSDDLWRKRIALSLGIGNNLIAMSALYHYSQYF